MSRSIAMCEITHPLWACEDKDDYYMRVIAYQWILHSDLRIEGPGEYFLCINPRTGKTSVIDATTAWVVYGDEPEGNG